MEETKRVDSSILYGPQLVGAKVRELLRGKYEVIPKTKEHIRVDSDKCIGMTCQICYITCPTGSLE
jgi:NAD-dependent dihydropyrimidine dehydrogenase PreA subunit